MCLENCSVIDKKELGIQKQKLFHCITKDGTKLSEGVGVFSGRRKKSLKKVMMMFCTKKAIISFDKLTFL